MTPTLIQAEPWQYPNEERTMEELTYNIKPLGERLVVKPYEGGTKTKGGIYLPDDAAKQMAGGRGRVVAVGEGKVRKDGTTAKPKCEVGQMVVYGKYIGTDIFLNGEKLVLLDEQNVYAVIWGDEDEPEYAGVRPVEFNKAAV